MRDYVATFVRVYREQAAQLQENEKAFFGEYIGEQILSEPSQVEVIEFGDPYRLIWLFLFDKTKPDLMISVHKQKWQNLSVLVAEFGVKHSQLQLDLRLMYKILQNFRDMNTDNIYSLDVIENAFFICFPHDVRLGGFWPRVLKGDSSPQAVAEAIFYLNYAQSWD